MIALQHITFRQVYYWTILILGISLTVSPFATSVCQFVLLGTWLVEGYVKKDFCEKFNRIWSNKVLLIFLSVYVIHVLGGIFADDLDFWFNDVKKKVPLFLIPFIIGSIEPISKDLYNRIIRLFIWTCFVATMISMALYFHIFGYEYTDIRYISLIISQVRFSLYIVVAIIFLFDDFITHRLNFYHGKYFINLGLVVWFIIYLMILRSLTGIISLSILLLIYLYAIPKKRKYRAISWIASAIVTTLVFAVGLMFISALNKFYNVRVPSYEELDKQTVNGNPYYHNLESRSVENGHLVNIYVSPEELREEWNKVSEYDFDSTDQKGQLIRYTIIRYLTSKGLRKDSAGISKLTEHDIETIENGYANYIYGQPLNIYSRIYQTVWEFYEYEQGGNPSYHSVAQRMEFLKAAIHIIKNHPLTGVGNGDLKIEYSKAYDEIETVLVEKRRLRAHNQYITFIVSFGFILGPYVIIALMWPFVANFKRFTLPEKLYFILILLSFLSEDTIESQAGVMFFIYFYTLIIFKSKFYSHENIPLNE